MKFKDKIWAAGLVAMEPLSSKNKNVKYLYVIDVFTKTVLNDFITKCFYAFITKAFLNAFIKTGNEFNHKTNKL